MGEVVQALAIVTLVLAAMAFVLVAPDALDRWLTRRASRRSRPPDAVR
jgi:HAMP domain-containing protein